MLEHASSRPRNGAALTPRERDVLSMVALGLTNAEAADRLDVTVHAIKFHLNHVYRKLNVSNRTEAAMAFHDMNGSVAAVVDDDVERQRVLFEWNDTAKAYPNAPVHELIAEQARANPRAVAVVDGFGTEMTYGDLDRRANKLANHLRTLGVGAETLVGIAVTRSASMLVGLLGILKAGGAYVPIDPSYPEERVRYMLENSAAPVVVTEESVVAGLPSHTATLVSIDGDAATLSQQSDEQPPSVTTAENLAYVIYTSGSTGKPKGVEIPHRALANFLATMAERPGLSRDDVLLAVTTLSFDIAGLELYLPLVRGARLVVAAQEATADPRELARLIDAHGVTAMQATPTTWRMLVDSGWSAKTGLKALCGGEALPLALADALVECGLELWNMYGPTETTIWSTTAPITTRGAPLTIGRPIANTTLYVLDEEMEAVPVGAEGELYIGGAGLARGYRGRPDLTAERFVPNPFVDEDERIYKTGDLVRYRDNGDVEYIGRLDHQVKVRGFRIELGEIETVLARHRAVTTAVAVAREDTPGEPRIVAYVTQDGSAASAAELREHAAKSLPAYMVPSAVVTLDDFPLTPNGKIDRKALPEPSREREAGASHVEPRTDLERRLVAIWERVLDVRPIGVTDDFFALGASSIVAARLFAEIEKKLGTSLPLAPVFQAPTIERLARLLEQSPTGPRLTSLVPIQATGTQTPIFCVHGGAGTVLHLQPLAARLGDDQPFYGLQARGLYGADAPLTRVEDMASHYLAELRTVQPHGPYRIGGYCFGTIVAFEMVQRLLADGEAVELLVMFNGPSPSWIRRWGRVDNQPGRAARVAAAAAPRRQLSKGAKVARAMRDREWAKRWIRWRLWKAWRFFGYRLDHVNARLRMKFGRPLSESLRESYFLRISAEAERAYEPGVYPGRIIVFRGGGLYDDPDLGWTDHAAGGIEAIEVPGLHADNRETMREPHVAFVAERLQESLAAQTVSGER